MTANAALSAAKSGRQAYIQTRAEGGSVAEAAGDATREAIDSSQHAVAEQED